MTLFPLLTESGRSRRGLSVDPHILRSVQQALAFWVWPSGAKAADLKLTCINISENHTFLVETCKGHKAILRLHRPDYSSQREIQSELNWLQALQEQLGHQATFSLPHPIKGLDGNRVQRLHVGVQEHFLVLFDFIEGQVPPDLPANGTMSQSQESYFRRLGLLAARLHQQARAWSKPPGFVRRTWDEEGLFGSSAHWGNWRAAPGLSHDMLPILEALEQSLLTSLATYGKGPDRFGLIHADMRLANLLVHGDRLSLIDFDDCGFSWYLYDFAASLSFMEDQPLVPFAQAAWVKGYESLLPLSTDDKAMLETLLMVRRLVLLAWIGSHSEAPEPQALAPHFAAGTVKLAKAYLSKEKRRF